MPGEGNTDRTRRTVLKTIGATAGAGALAGCLGGGDDDGNGNGNGNGDDGTSPSGERVPTIGFDWYSLGGVYDPIAELVVRDMENLGFDVNVGTGDFAGVTDRAAEDRREHNMHMYGYGPSTARLDPHEFVHTALGIHNAGASGPNYANYANCEYSYHAHQQSVAPDDETRADHVRQAIEIAAEDKPVAPIITYIEAGYGRSDIIDFQRVGQGSISDRQHWWMIYSQPAGDVTTLESIHTSAYVQTINWPTMSGAGSMDMWSHIYSSSLWEYDENFQLQGVLAEDWEYSNEGLTLTVELREGSFQNGDPITASDVKFTFEQLQRHTDVYPLASTQPIDSIDVIDDLTVQFNWTEPNPQFQTSYAVTWGIMHQDSYEAFGADEDPMAYDPDPSEGEFVGSGPWQIIGMTPGEQVISEPHDGHPYHDRPGFDRMVWNLYDEVQAATNAVIQGEMHVHPGSPLSAIARAEQEIDADNLETRVEAMPTARLLQLQNSFAPGMFYEWRNAIGMCFNRQEINTVGFEGQAEPLLESSLFPPAHPSHPGEDVLPKFTDDPTGDMDGAVQELEDAGWERDSSGDWHYPPDADLTPPWPAESRPSPDDFPCITADGDYNRDYEL